MCPLASRTHYRAMRAVLGRCRRALVWPFSSDCRFRCPQRHELFRPSLGAHNRWSIHRYLLARLQYSEYSWP
jgi:hypothetical protein